MRKLTMIMLAALAATACSHIPSVPSIPGIPSVVYRPPVQQGNIISSKTIAQLNPGMTQDQVLQLLGEPVLKDPYNDNRWFYVYSYANNRSRLTSQKRLTLYFSNGILKSYNSTLNGKNSSSAQLTTAQTYKLKKAEISASAVETQSTGSTPPGGPAPALNHSALPEVTLPVPADLIH